MNDGHVHIFLIFFLTDKKKKILKGAKRKDLCYLFFNQIQNDEHNI